MARIQVCRRRKSRWCRRNRARRRWPIIHCRSPSLRTAGFGRHSRPICAPVKTAIIKPVIPRCAVGVERKRRKWVKWRRREGEIGVHAPKNAVAGHRCYFHQRNPFIVDFELDLGVANAALSGSGKPSTAQLLKQTFSAYFSYCVSFSFVFGSRFLRWCRGGRPIVMPVKAPKIIQFDHLYMAVIESHIDGSFLWHDGHRRIKLLSNRDWRCRRFTAMPPNCAALHSENIVGRAL